MSLLAALLVTASMASASVPSAGYCDDTLHGRAGFSWLADDNEARWRALRIEREDGINIAYNDIHQSVAYDSNTRYVVLGFHKSNGTLWETWEFLCRNYYGSPNGLQNDYTDWPKGWDVYGWYNG